MLLVASTADSDKINKELIMNMGSRLVTKEKEEGVAPLLFSHLDESITPHQFRWSSHCNLPSAHAK
mgnify:CR=1 FL=1